MKINSTTDDVKDKYTKYLNVKNDSTDYDENIENEELSRGIIIQMLKCDEELTKAAEAKFKSYEQEKRC